MISIELLSKRGAVLKANFYKPFDWDAKPSENFAADYIEHLKKYIIARKKLNAAMKKSAPQNSTEVMFWEIRVKRFRSDLRFYQHERKLAQIQERRKSAKEKK